MKKTFFLFIISASLINLHTQTTFRIWANNIDLPISNDGVLADVNINQSHGGRIDSIGFLFSGGFFLSGKSGDSLWANGQASASRVQDYRAGNVDSLYYDPRYSLYIVQTSDPAFGESWLRWKFAVDLGADYYDGNNDGIYNPIDLNGNGVWNTNEDKPDILGNLTAWCVYNDGVTKSLRRYNNIDPQGIEIHQTVFAFNNWQTPTSPVNNTIFIRYRLINKGKVVDRMDSVYFSAWTDTDIGYDYFNDLTGCDTNLSAGYVYKDSSDQSFGNRPPAHFIQLLQGPYSFIPGVTFIDINSNGVFDEGTDIPLDTAYNFKGSLLAVQEILGAKNLDMTSFTGYSRSHFFQGDPSTSNEARNYMLGLRKHGIKVDPCTWTFGSFYGGVNCNDVNPLYWYSGDPIIPVGWIHKYREDQRSMINTGPFQLFKNKPVDIIVAYVVARGNTPLNAVGVTRNYCKGIKQFYNSNFMVFPTDVQESNEVQLNDFHLYQNYPNPFNPSTRIQYQVSSSSKVTLKVYDVLGNEVATLVDEYKPVGSYEVEFKSAIGSRQLASGVYYYQLRVADFVQTKKMILLR